MVIRKGSVKEMLSKLKYDPREDENDYYVVIEHRGRGTEEIEISVGLIELGRGYFFLDDAQIPYHRILRVVRNDGKVVWETRKVRL